MNRPLTAFILVLLLAGCVPAAIPTETLTVALPVEPTETLAVALPAQPSPTPAWDYRLVISTTSDWTRVQLLSGMTITRETLVSSSPGATRAAHEGDAYVLNQPLVAAGSGSKVEMTFDLMAASATTPQDVVIAIDRGHQGFTTVNLQRYTCGVLAEVASLRWDGIQPSGGNLKQFTIPAAQLAVASTNEYIVIAQLNFWYFGPEPGRGHVTSAGDPVTPTTPLLGRYDAADPQVVKQQIDWAAAYGVDAFSIEWTTPRGEGCCGSMEETLDDVFLKAPNIDKVRWVIFYDFPLRLMQTKGLESYAMNFDFDQPAVANTLIADFQHFARKYFGESHYLTIDDRPVIYIWASNAFHGDLAGTLRAARQIVSDEGYDVFIVGDEVMAGNFNRAHAALFDGNTTFTFLIPGLNQMFWTNVGKAVPEVDRVFTQWQRNINNLQVTGRTELVNFQPAWGPQYDERFNGWEKPNPIYVPATSRDQVLAMAEMARTHAEPVGDEGLKLVWVNTWNCWGETTSIEPTIYEGPTYPNGNYGFDFLEIVRDVYGSVTYACQAP